MSNTSDTVVIPCNGRGLERLITQDLETVGEVVDPDDTIYRKVVEKDTDWEELAKIFNDVVKDKLITHLDARKGVYDTLVNIIEIPVKRKRSYFNSTEVIKIRDAVIWVIYKALNIDIASWSTFTTLSENRAPEGARVPKDLMILIKEHNRRFQRFARFRSPNDELAEDFLTLIVSLACADCSEAYVHGDLDKFLHDLLERDRILAIFDSIYEYAVFAACLSTGADISSLQKDKAKVEATVLKLSRIIERLEAENMSLKEKQQTRMIRASKVARLEAENARLKEELTDKEQLINGIEHEIRDPLYKKIESLERELSELQEVLSDDCGQASGETEVIEPDREVLARLPESGVVFVGGHENLVNKLKLKYPKWSFISAEFKEIGPVRPDYILVYTKHMSHKAWSRMKRAYPNVPRIYVYGTNTNILLSNAVKSYNQVLRSSGG